jgi:hypothetical protein
MDGSIFDWLLWRNGNPLDIFGIVCRTVDFVRKRELLRKHAIGWCPAEKTICRPKLENVAVMFDVNGHVFWFHLRQHEFDAIFGVS